MQGAKGARGAGPFSAGSALVAHQIAHAVMLRERRVNRLGRAAVENLTGMGDSPIIKRGLSTFGG
jgi:hypothetical protein